MDLDFDKIKEEHIIKHHFEQCKEIKTKVVDELEEMMEKNHSKIYHTVSANLNKFMPEIKEEDHFQILKDIRESRAKMMTETYKPTLIKEIIRDTGDIDKTKLPAIFCTYHLGSYKSIIGLLAKEGIDFDLVIDERTIDTQAEHIHEVVNNVKSNFGTNIQFNIISAESKAVSLEVTKSLREKRSVVIYIDGNTGVGGVFKKDNSMLPIDFLGQPIYSRKGVATLGIMNNVPIIPVVSYYKDDFVFPKIEFLEPIVYNKEQTRQEAIVSITKQLFEILEKYVRMYPNQYEAWMYFHKYLDFDRLPKRELVANKLTEEAHVRFNKMDYALFKMDEDFFIFDKLTYGGIQIGEGIFELLTDLSNRTITLKELYEMNRQTIESLIASKILVA